MFGLYSKLSEFVWGCEESEDTNSQASKRNLREKRTVSKGIADDVGYSRFSQNPNFKKELVGKVTRLYDGAGLIDDEVYFTFDKVIGGERPEVGTEVLAEAFRESEMAGWRAVRVQVMSEWKLDENEKPASVETLIGSITNIANDSGVVDNEISFKMSCVRQGYVPFSGDWVKLDVDRAEDGTIEVTGVMPLREKNFTGVVTYVSCGVGYIDGEVCFTCGICSRGYRPRKGDTVKTTAIESKQGKAVWRAIKVEPIRTSSSVLR